MGQLTVYYSDPPQTDAEKQADEEKRQNGEYVEERKTMYDITNYLIDAQWNGDVDQAARKLQMHIAYNVEHKDKVFKPLILKIGGFIYAYYTDETVTNANIFSGRIFFAKRNTSGYDWEYVAYDDMVYLAKSKVQLKFSQVTVTDAIRTVCGEIGIPVADDIPQIATVVNYIADGKSCTEVFRALAGFAKADPNNTLQDFTVQCIGDKVTLVKKGEKIQNYIATDDYDIEHTEHSQSIEDMVNRIKAVDDVGNVCQVFTINDDVTHYGMIQEVYKMQPPKTGETVDNVANAKSKLKQLKEESSLEGVGNIQCITGYGITIQEQQLQGDFFIKSDTHKFSNGQHTMTLQLEYMPKEVTQPTIEEQDLATPVFKSSKRGRRKSGSNGQANMTVDSGMDAGYSAWGGVRMENGSNGCAEAAGKVGSYYSPFLKQECENGVVGVEQMVADAGGGIPFDTTSLEKGDVIVYGDNDHVVIYDGEGGYIGNSSSKQQVVHGRDYRRMSGLQPTRILKTSRM